MINRTLPYLSAPSQPSSIKLDAKSSSTLSVSWGAPDSWNGVPAGYEVDLSGYKLKFDENTTDVMFTDLSQGTEYTISVVVRCVTKNESRLHLTLCLWLELSHQVD